MRPTTESARLQMDAQARAQQLRAQMDQVKGDALKAAPALQKIANTLTPPELFARAQALSQLEAVRRDPSGTLGTTEAIRQGGSIKQNIEYVIGLLSTEADPKKFENTIFESYFLGWDSPGNANVAIVKPTRMSVYRFLGSFVNDAQIVSSIFSKPRETNEGLDATKIGQISNLSEFLLALEVRNPGAKYKKMFLAAQTALQNKNLEEAMKSASFVQDEWNIDLNSVLTKEGKQKALRAIGSTQEASKVSMNAAREMVSSKERLSSQQTALVKELMDNLERQKGVAEKGAQDRYAQMLSQIPTHNPLYHQIVRNKTAVIDELKNEVAYLKIVDGFIKKNGSKGLGTLLESYDDMKGLYGWNISDESAKMTKEGIIMLASFAVTAGIGPLLGAAGVLARAGVAASAAHAAELAEAGHKIKAGYFLAQKATLKGVAITTEYGAQVASLHERNKYTSRATETGATLGQRLAGGAIRISGESAKFTLADTLIRAGWRSPGETSPYDSMLENFMRNTAMFAAFGGMEIFTTKWKDKALKALNIKNPTATFIVGNTVLTAGDVAAMWALGVAETGELHVPNTYEMLQALAFRVGMKGTEQLPALIKEKFPRLSEKYKQLKQGGVNPEAPLPTVSSVQVSGRESSVSGGNRRLNPERGVTFKTPEEYFKSRPKEVQERVQSLSKEIGPIDTNVVVAVPFYAKESVGELVTALKSQKPNGEKIVIYVNAPKTGSSAVSEGEFTQKVQELKRATADDPRFVIIQQHYATRQTIGTIRADMADAISMSIKPGTKDPILVGLDADTYKLSSGYFQKVREHFDKNPDVSWGVANLRWSEPGLDQAVWLSERMMQAKWNPRRNGTNENTTWSSGGASSFRIDRYVEAGGYNRQAHLGEDTNLGQSMNNARGGFSGSRIAQKVSVDPRRGTQELQNGGIFETQWKPDFSPVDKSTFSPEKLKEINAITETMRTGGTLSGDQVNTMQVFMNRHFDYGNYFDIQGAQKFAKFWNTQATNSGYKLIVGDRAISIAPRNSQASNQTIISAPSVSNPRPSATPRVSAEGLIPPERRLGWNGKLSSNEQANNSVITRLQEEKQKLSAELNATRLRLTEAAKPISLKSFESGAMGDSVVFMREAGVGTQMKLDLWDNAIGQKGFAIYEKGTDGKWIHRESNISGDGMFVHEVFAPHIRPDGSYGLQSNKKDLIIREYKFSIPHDKYVAEFLQPIREKLNKPKVGDMVTLPDNSTWRYAQGNPPWVKVESIAPALTSNVGGTRKTTQELQEALLTNAEKIQGEIKKLEGDIAHTDAQISAENARVVGNPQRAPVVSQIAPLTGRIISTPRTSGGEPIVSGPRVSGPENIGLSFRTEMKDIMKLDDATFQKNFTDVQYRKGQEGNRPYEVEMYEAAAKVRRLSDAEIIKHADDVIRGNREFMGSRNPNRGPSDLTLSDKALMVSEHAALRYRMKEVIGKNDPALTPILDNPKDAAVALKDEKNWRRWLPLGLIPLILGALWLALKERNPDTTVAPPGPGDAGSPDAAADYCQQCSDGALSEIRYNRSSDVNNRIILDAKRREDISNRWMKKNPEWKKTIQLFQSNRSSVDANSPETKSVASSLDAVLKNPSVQNVQELQRCIGMVANDDKTAQDGILGPITTGNLLKIINGCITPK